MARLPTPAIRPLVWIGSTKKDLLALPDAVIDTFGYALHLAQIGKKHEQAKPLHGFGSAGVLEIVEDWRGNTYRAVYTVRFAASRRAARLPEEGEDRRLNAEAGHGLDQTTTDGCRTVGEGVANMSKRKTRAADGEVGTANVYADLNYIDADQMLIKAQLVTKIAEIIKRKGL